MVEFRGMVLHLLHCPFCQWHACLLWNGQDSFPLKDRHSEKCSSKRGGGKTKKLILMAAACKSTASHKMLNSFFFFSFPPSWNLVLIWRNWVITVLQKVINLALPSTDHFLGSVLQHFSPHLIYGFMCSASFYLFSSSSATISILTDYLSFLCRILSIQR